MTDYRQLIGMVTQMMMVGMLGGIVKVSPMMLQEAKKPTIKSLEARVSSLEERIGVLEGKPAKKALFGGRATAVPIIDTTTKRVYHSKFTAGKSLAAEAGTNEADKFAWYKLIAKFPNRFREATEAEISRAQAAGTYLQTEGE